MENNSPYVIIPPEHQSAPNVPVIVPPSAPTPQPGSSAPLWGDDAFDRELDHPAYHNRSLAEEYAALPRLEATPTLTLEKMLEVREMNYYRARAQRWAGQERWMGKENEAQRLVNFKSPDEFIRTLRRAGFNAGASNPVVAEYIRQRKAHCPHTAAPATCDCLKEITGTGGPRIWLNDFIALITVRKPDGTMAKVSSQRVGVNAWVTPEPGTKAWEQNVYVMRTVSTLQDPLSPEWTLMRFNDYDVPTNERYRGWRTVLLALIVAGVLSEEQAHAAFGVPCGPASDFYREQLYLHRCRRYVDEEKQGG